MEIIDLGYRLLAIAIAVYILLEIYDRYIDKKF